MKRGTKAIIVALVATMFDWTGSTHPAKAETTVKRTASEQSAVVSLPSVAAGRSHTLVLKNDGTVWAFGSNGYGQLGNANIGPRPNPAPKEVTGLTNVTEIAAGSYHSVALKSDGSVWTFGLNDSGQLGYESGTDYNPTPRKVPSLTGIVDIAAGGLHTMALKSDGTMWTFGYNGYGELGRPFAEIYRDSTPNQVSGIVEVTQLAGGSQHTVAVKSNGDVFTFGHNFYGQLGFLTANPFPNSTPGKVLELTQVIEVAASANNTVGLRRDGTIQTFGYNGRFELGYPTANYFDQTPREVPGVTNVARIAAGGSHTIALHRDGTITTFGDNSAGQLGYLTVTSNNYRVPLTVPELAGVSAIAAGAAHTIVLTNDGGVWGFGDNSFGQLGYTANTGTNPTPTRVGDFNVFPLVSDTPARILDTRIGGTTVDGDQQGIGRLYPNSVLQLRLSGRGPISATTSAVALNLTITDPTGPGYVTVWPCGTPQPNASNLNFVSGQTIANMVIAKIGTDGNVCVAIFGASAHLIADFNEQYSNVGALSALPPARLLDTRLTGTTIDGRLQGIGYQAPETVLALPVLNRGGTGPAAELVVLNMTVTAPTGPGYLTVWPCGGPKPNASSLNYRAGETIANVVFTKVGINGTVCVSPSISPTHIIADVAAVSNPGSSNPITALTPARILDTRVGAATIDGVSQGVGSVPARAIVGLPVRGRIGIGPNATTAILNVTITDPKDGGYLTVWPCGTPQPNASNINFSGGQTIANNVIVKLGGGGRICFVATVSTHMIADLTAIS